MASSSLLQPSALLSHSSSSSTLSVPVDIPTRSSLCVKKSGLFSRQTKSLGLKSTTSKIRSAIASDLGVEAGVEAIREKLLYPELKLNLLSAVAGLNKGLVATKADMKKVDAAAKALEDAGGPVDLKASLDKLQGLWKLAYSSGFSSRTLGGSRPGPSTGSLLPISLGQVFQRIDIFSKDFNNIVEVQLGTPWPFPPIEATATLAHKFEVMGSAKIKIIFEKTTVKATGNLSQLPTLELPKIPEQFRPSSNPGSGEFEVTYIDADMRITRGDRGELRVFLTA
ncbi:Plastid-lipid-associated protein 6 [Ranunculus cassubicifolius]